MATLDHFRQQSGYSDPGRHTALVLGIADDIESLCAAARNTIVHYRAELPDLPEEPAPRDRQPLAGGHPRRGPVPTPEPLTEPRELDLPGRRLLPGPFPVPHRRAAGARRAGPQRRGLRRLLRAAVPPRPRRRRLLGRAIAGCARTPNWLREASTSTSATCSAAPVRRSRRQRRCGRATAPDSSTPTQYGVAPDLPLRGPDFIGTYVVFQVAHRYGDELLLWDDWDAAVGSRGARRTRRPARPRR